MDFQVKVTPEQSQLLEEAMSYFKPTQVRVNKDQFDVIKSLIKMNRIKNTICEGGYWEYLQISNEAHGTAYPVNDLKEVTFEEAVNLLLKMKSKSINVCSYNVEVKDGLQFGCTHIPTDVVEEIISAYTGKPKGAGLYQFKLTKQEAELFNRLAKLKNMEWSVSTSHGYIYGLILNKEGVGWNHNYDKRYGKEITFLEAMQYMLGYIQVHVGEYEVGIYPGEKITFDGTTLADEDVQKIITLWGESCK